MKKEANTNMETSLLDWSAKQGRILTDEGKAVEYYCSERGFPFTSAELPHHHLEKRDSHEVFHGWAVTAAAANRTNDDDDSSSQRCPIIGAWSRPLFTGKWEHSTNNEEIVFNIQTGTLFIDLRIPTSKPVSRWENLSSSSTINNNYGRQNPAILSSRQILESMSDEDLRLYARQHVFAGYSIISQEKNNNSNGMSKKLSICTRHHCIDWNYVSGKPRPRPNKWYIEGKSSNTGHDSKNYPFNVWKEWSYSTDENGQCYYWEKWERISGDEFGKGLRLAMRRRKSISGNKNDGDAIIVAVGDHFNYIEGRKFLDLHTRYADVSNTVDLVDLALQNGDRETAISYLSLMGGHGTISSGWKVDCALQPWQHGKNLFSDCLRCSSEDIKVMGSGAACTSWQVVMGDESVWDVYECSLSRHKLQQLLLSSRKTSRL
ncbi:hypothetical protein ACHAWC_007841 [Mediolabrus comicus]